MIKRTYSLNLIAYLRSHDVEVDTYSESGRIYGLYQESNEAVLLKELYREDEELHRFLREFKELNRLQ